MTLIENLKNMHQQINVACKVAGRSVNEVKLLAVSKQQSADKIRTAYLAEQKDFGENYVQEALQKMQQLSDLNITWHFIGRIQTNKTRYIAENFSWVHTLDHENIAKRLNDQRPLHLTPLEVCIQVNLAKETQKAGVDPENIKKLALFIQELPQLKLRGLMALPPIAEDYNQQFAYFHKLKHYLFELQQEGLNVDTLSMGMSLDFKAAIASGSTIVRIGTAIFGKR